MLPLVALVGRPNVGKSTLFNRIVGRRIAIVEDRPGVTRDRQYHDAEHAGRLFRAVDTGGFTSKSDELLIKAVREQAKVAIAEAAVIILVAVLGRPNVGKSTLLNRLIGSERFVASALPGTTRDAVDETVEHKGRTFVLTDTAGLRKKRQVIDRVEVFSAQKALRAVEKADVVVVLTAATDLGVDQDARIAAPAEERGRAIILVVNKWDLVKDKEAESERVKEEAKRHLQHVGFAPMLFISALDGTRVGKILDLAAELHDEASVKLSTPKLNDWLQAMQDEHPAPLWRGFPVRFSYAYQVASQPVTIAVQVNRPQAIVDSYRRYLVNGLREIFKLLFKEKSHSQPRGKGEKRQRRGSAE